MLKKILPWLVAAGIVSGYYYIDKASELKRKAVTLYNMQQYGIGDVVARVDEYREATGEYPNQEAFQDLLTKEDVKLPDGSTRRFSYTPFIPKGQEKEAEEFRFKPTYNPEGRVTGGIICNRGLDNDYDDTIEKDLQEDIKKIVDQVLPNPWYIIRRPDGDLRLGYLGSEKEKRYKTPQIVIPKPPWEKEEKK